MTRSKHALVAILLLAAGLRLFALARYPPALHGDEAFNGINALQVVHLHQIKVFYPENNGREGLFINLQALAVALFGVEVWPLRLVSAIFGTLTVAGLFFLVRELCVAGGSRPRDRVDAAAFDPDRLALVTAFLAATSFWHVLVSRLAFRASSAPFWAVWAFYLLFVSWRTQSSVRAPVFAPRGAPVPAGRRGTWVMPLLAGMVFGLGFHSYTAYRVMPLVAAVLFAFQYGEAHRARRRADFATYVVAVTVGAILAIAPLAWHFVRHPSDFYARAAELSVFDSPTPVRDVARNVIETAGMLHIVGDTNPRHNLTGRPWLARVAGLAGATPAQQELVRHLGRPELFWPVGLLFLIGLYLGVRMLRRDTYVFQHVFLWSWLVVSGIPAVVSNQDLPHALRTILAIPPVLIYAAMGALVIYDRVVNAIEARPGGWQSPAARMAAAACAVVLIAQVAVAYFLEWGPAPITAERFDKDTNDTALRLRAIPAGVPKYVIVSPASRGLEIVQYLTDTYTVATQDRNQLHYIRSDDLAHTEMPAGAYVTRLK